MNLAQKCHLEADLLDFVFHINANMSHRVMANLGQLTPRLEIYTINEAFCDLAGIPAEQLESLGRLLREEVRRRTHLAVGVGIAPTKTLAKLANYTAKTWHKTGGVFDLSAPARQCRLMAHVPVEEVWGIGQRIARRLATMGITLCCSWPTCRRPWRADSSRWCSSAPCVS